MSNSTVDVHESQQTKLRATTIAMIVLAATFVALRFTSRWKKGLTLGIDDYTILVALGFLFADGGFNLALIHYGMGLHAQILDPENLVMIGKVLMAYECVYSTTIGVIKVSILLMYARIFPTRGFRIAALVLGAISASWVIAIVFVSIFQCTPVEKTWDPALPGSCINLKGSFVGNAVPNILTDVAILSLPVKVVWGLHANVTHRLSVIVVFLLGSFVVFTSIYRFTTLFQFQSADISWTLSTACTWCVVECASGIISACLPTLRPLFLLISTRFNNSSGSRTIQPKKAHSRHGGTLYGSNGLPFSRLSSNGFRPAHEQLGDAKIQLEVNNIDDVSGDEVPLNTIMVRRDVTWKASENIGRR